MDSFHECLQEYGEGLEVVQICLEPEDASIKDEEISALDFSLDECLIKKPYDVTNDNTKSERIVNGITDTKLSKSDESLDERDDDMTITEDDVLTTPRELPDVRRKSIDSKSLSKQQSKDISTSDEMVFAVTPTGLERISFEKYWDDTKFDKNILGKHQSEDSSKECLSSPDDVTPIYQNNRMSVQENSMLFIDHDADGYETCLDDDSYSTRVKEKPDTGSKISIDHIKEAKPNKLVDKQIKIEIQTNKANDVAAKSRKRSQIFSNSDTEDPSYGYPYIQEHIIKQMQSLRIEPLNVNIGNRKKKRSPSKPSKSSPKPSSKKNAVKSPTVKSQRKCVEYYNDQAECLEEYKRQKKLEEDERKTKEEERMILKSNLEVMEKKLQLKKQEPSEESTDQEFVPGCHKCFLENYAYAITKAYIAEASSCKYCEVIRDMLELESPKEISERRMSAPALVSLDLVSSESDEENSHLLVPIVKDRRTSAGPLKFIVPSRRLSYVPKPVMTVTASSRRGNELTAQRWGQPRRVTLSRSPGTPLGVSIVGGKVDIISNDSDDGEEKAIFGIFIKNVVANSPAGYSCELHTGDRILEVDGICVRSASHERAVQLIKAAGDTVTLTVQSLVAWNTDSSDVEVPSPQPSRAPSVKKGPAPLPPPVADSTPQHEIKITVTSEPDIEDKEEKESTSEAEAPKTVYSDSDSSDDEDERDLGGRTYSDKGAEIDRASAGAIKRTREEKEADPEEEDDFGYTTNKIRKKYANLGDQVVSVRLERSAKAGLGLSLAGHRDRSRMAVFICGLNPAGSAARAVPPVKVGDEILEVNGIVLHGRCHLNASAIIKGLGGPVFRIILLRRKQALEDVAVKPLTQFPVALEEESEDRFASYKGVRNVSIRKGTSSLGIMIIEGRHAEVGQGIFISDIQEGSAAEQAGLQIGDMILAVNKDSLLGCSYDAAAATLKRTEGLVVLTVCNPNKKDDSPTDETGSIGGGSRSHSRSASRNQTPDPGGLKASGASRPTTPKPAPSPVKAEPPPDPATAPIVSNKDTIIEISTEKKSLGLLLLGGSDTLINGAGAVILEVYPNGAAGKDGRLKAGDQIFECAGVAITKEMSHERLCLTIKRTAEKIRMTVHRPDPIPYQDVEVELVKKPGKGIGLGLMARTPAPGVYISDLLPGGPADLDGKLQRGDILHSVDGKDLSSADHDTAAAAFKSAGTKVAIKVKRFKIVR